MSRLSISEEYFEWMYDMVCEGRYSGTNAYRKLLRYLHNAEYVYTLRGDADRERDGISLRHRFALRHEENDYWYIMESLSGPCSMLEMILALAIRCEESIMSDPRIGDRTGQWFWKMITNLGLGGMTDSNYDEIHVDWSICRFLSHEYEPDGEGGLFRVRRPDGDFRRMTIWKQMCCFLDTMI